MRSLDSDAVRVSLVVPVYNAERYVRTCLESLQSQTVCGFEVVVVLDAPTDHSADIVDEFAADPRFTIVRHELNAGQASARNTGLDLTSGEYVGFVDSDDFVRHDMCEVMLDVARRERADIVSCAYTRTGQDGSAQSDHPFPVVQSPLGRDGIAEALAAGHSSRMLWFVCRNLYRRALLVEHDVRFEPGLRTGVDTIFNLHAFAAARRWAATQDALYFYRYSPESLTMSPWVPHLTESLQRSYELKSEICAGLPNGPVAFADMQRYVVRHLLPRLVANAAHHPDRVARLDAVREVLTLAMIRESLPSTQPWQKSMPPGIRAVVALAKARQGRALLAMSERRRAAQPVTTRK